MDRDFEMQYDPVTGIMRVEGNEFNLTLDEGRFAAEAFAYRIFANHAEHGDVADRILRKVEEAKKAA